MDNGMANEKEHHCFAVSGRSPCASTRCAIIDNRSLKPKAMIQDSDLVSPEKAKSAFDAFFGGANVVIQHACTITPAHTGNDPSAPAAKRPRT